MQLNCVAGNPFGGRNRTRLGTAGKLCPNLLIGFTVHQRQNFADARLCDLAHHVEVDSTMLDDLE